MASNFAFIPMGLTVPITVGTSLSTSTVWLANYGGGTGTLVITTGNYPPGGFRIACVGTIPVFINFAPAGQANTAGVGTAMPLFPNTIESFCTRGQNSIAHISAGTATLYVTPGEGL